MFNLLYDSNRSLQKKIKIEQLLKNFENKKNQIKVFYINIFL